MLQRSVSLQERPKRADTRDDMVRIGFSVALCGIRVGAKSEVEVVRG